MNEVRPGIFLVSLEGRGSALDALRAGARALLPESATEDDIESAALATRGGFVIVHPEVARVLAGDPAYQVDDEPARADRPDDPPVGRAATPPRARPASEAPRVERLTRREVEVLNLLADGLGNKQIAARLGISDHTVKAHLGAIFQKLDVSSRTEAVMLGARRGLVML